MKKKCIIVSGSVMSNIGKGIFTASLSSLYNNPHLIKIDPYLNINAGYFNPLEHGEVYVTHDGRETDLDLGYYEKFIEKPLSEKNVLTGGKINFIALRKGIFMRGKTCRLRDIVNDIYKIYFSNQEFIIIELGGTIDDEEYYWLPLLLECITQEFQIFHIHLVPIIKNLTGEIKSKPIQNSLKYLKTISFPCDIILLRCISISEEDKKYILDKISYTNKKVIFLENFNNIYQIPNYLKSVLIDIPFLNENKKHLESDKIKLLRNAEQQPRIEKKILLINKYSKDLHVYWHLIETLKIECLMYTQKYKLRIINCYIGDTIDKNIITKIRECDAVVLPGGFGHRGWQIYRIIFWLSYKMFNKKILGICWGKQSIVCTLLRLNGWENANTQEFNPKANVYIYKKINLGALRLLTDSNDYIWRRFRNRYHLSPQASNFLERIVEWKTKNSKGVIQSFRYQNRIFACQFHPEFYYNYKDIDNLIKDFIISLVA